VEDRKGSIHEKVFGKIGGPQKRHSGGVFLPCARKSTTGFMEGRLRRSTASRKNMPARVNFYRGGNKGDESWFKAGDKVLIYIKGGILDF
jgi:hypothetical protein